MISCGERNPQTQVALAPVNLHGPLVAACFFGANSNGFSSGLSAVEILQELTNQFYSAPDV